MYSQPQDKSFNKGFLFLIIFVATMFLNRFISILFSPNVGSIFTFFAGGLINYTALFFIFLSISIYNFKKTFKDERLQTILDILLALCVIFTLFVVLFPSLSIKLSFVHIPLVELLLITLLSFLAAFTKEDKSIQFHKKLSWRVLFFFILPYSLIIYLKYPPRLILLSLLGKNYASFITILFAVLIFTAIIAQILNRKKRIFVKSIINLCFAYTSVIFYLAIFPMSILINLQRFAFALFYIVAVPLILMLIQRKNEILRNLAGIK